MIDSLLVLHAGGYGPMLQANYVNKAYIVREFRLIDDYKTFDTVKYLYPHTSKRAVYNLDESVILPCADMATYTRFGLAVGGSPDWDSKLWMHRLVSSINRIHVSECPLTTVAVKKPSTGSGSKDISIGWFNAPSSGYIFQPYCSGSELIVDLSVGYDVVRCTARKSLYRVKGRDRVISFDIDNDDIARIHEVVEDFVSHLVVGGDVIWTGCANIQMRKMDGIWKVMEIDFRLSGSSIVSSQYNFVINPYLKNKYPRVMKFNGNPEIWFERGKFNEDCIDVFSDCGLSVPSVC